MSVKTNVGRVTIWLAPEMVNFDEHVTIAVDGHSRTEQLKGSAETILDDVRTRADRQHPFWVKLDKDTGRSG